MRKVFTLAVILLLQIALFAPQADLTVSAAKKEKSKPVKIASEEQADISLINENYLLEGLVDQVHFYYEVPVDKLKGDNYVYLHVDRSEEHTSELQSRFDLVCRLLLEKKKKKKERIIRIE